MKKIISLGVVVYIVLAIQTVFAQAVWLQPKNALLAANDTLKVSLRTGENFTPSRFDFSNLKVEEVVLLYGTEKQDLKKQFDPSLKIHLSLSIKIEGTYLLIVQSSQRANEYGIQDFKEYLKAHDFDDALEKLEQAKSSDKNIRENYFHSAKLVFQCGKTKSKIDNYVSNTPLEIIPLSNPYELKRGDYAKYKILWNGKPLFGVRVQLWNRFANRTTIQNIYTEQDGTITAPVSEAGLWMISVEKIIPNGTQADEWTTYVQTLVYSIY